MPSTPGVHPDRAFVIDTLVEAILDASDPDGLTTSSRVSLRNGRVDPVVLVRLHGAQWELSLDGWGRAVGDLAYRSRSRSLAAPSIGGAMQTLLDAGTAACRNAAAYDVRSAH